MFSTIEEASVLQKEIGVDIFYTQTERGPYQGKLSILEYNNSNNFLINEVHSTSLIAQGVAFQTHYFFVITNQSITSSITLNSFSNEENGIVLYPPNSDLYANTKGLANSYQLAFEKQYFESQYLTLFHEPLLINEPIFIAESINPSLFKSISKAAVMMSVDECADVIDLHWPKIEINTLQFLKNHFSILLHQSNLQGRPRKDSTQILKVILEYIHSHISEKIDYFTLCKNFHISVSTLERIFLEQLGITPKKYIFMHRMQQIRLSLSQSNINETTVTELAYKFGISHTGRLAANYANLFQEKPSETLSKKKNSVSSTTIQLKTKL